VVTHFTQPLGLGKSHEGGHKWKWWQMFPGAQRELELPHGFPGITSRKLAFVNPLPVCWGPVPICSKAKGASCHLCLQKSLPWRPWRHVLEICLKVSPKSLSLCVLFSAGSQCKASHKDTRSFIFPLAKDTGQECNGSPMTGKLKGWGSFLFLQHFSCDDRLGLA
jgi:hypothetical protein